MRRAAVSMAAFLCLALAAGCNQAEFGAKNDKKSRAAVKPGPDTEDAHPNCTGDDCPAGEPGGTPNGSPGGSPAGTPGGDVPKGDKPGEKDIALGESDTVGEKVTRITMTAVIDHDSELFIKDTELYFRHTGKGVPQKVKLTFYGEKGVLNTRDWVPTFKNGQGPNCVLGMRATLYCEKACDCVSNKLKLKKGHSLSGALTKTAGRGVVRIDGHYHITIQDHADDVGHYAFEVK